jgi:acetyl esterase/lipase
VIRRRLFLAFLAAIPVLSFGQSLPAIDALPPAIAFSDWKEVSRPEGAIEYLVDFPSDVPTGYPENDTVTLRVFLPTRRTGPVPTVLVLHYWGATDLRVERTLAQELNRRGLGAAILTLPYHLSRAPAGTRSGQLAIQPDVDRLKITMVQAVHDCRRAVDLLAGRGEIDTRRMGIVGTSLGALVAAVAFGVEERLTDATYLLGGVDIAGILWTSSRVVGQRDMLRRRGYTETRLREALASIEPQTLLSRRETGTSFVVGAQFDTVIQRRFTEQLIATAPDPRVLWLDTGHYGGIFVQRRLMREVATYFATEFTGGTFVAPRRLYAPTIRIGFRFDTLNGIDLGAGIDIWQFDPRGDTFSSVLLTPRGLNLFLGRRISQGLSLGAFGSTRGVGVGLMWSTVL